MNKSREKELSSLFTQLEQANEEEVYSRKSRPLTELEIEFIKIFYGTDINYSKVKLLRGGFVTIRGHFVTINNRIYIPKKQYEDEYVKRDDEALEIGNHQFLVTYLGRKYRISYTMAVLIHELCHVWAYQRPDITYYFDYALLEHIRYGKKVYQYELDTSKELLDYRWEQQGQIMQDYVRPKLLKPEHPETKNYETVIYASIHKIKHESNYSALTQSEDKAMM